MIDATVLAIALAVIGAVGLVCGFVAGWHWRGWRDGRQPPANGWTIRERIAVRKQPIDHTVPLPDWLEAQLEELENRR